MTLKDKFWTLFHGVTGTKHWCSCWHWDDWYAEFDLESGRVYYQPTGGGVCHHCWLNSGFRCPLCNAFITPGTSVVLFSISDPNFPIYMDRVIFCRSPLVVVGCHDCVKRPKTVLLGHIKLFGSGVWEVPGRVVVSE